MLALLLWLSSGSANAQNQQDLPRVIAKLNATGAKIIWISSAPIRYSRSNIFKLGSESEHNEITDTNF